LEGWWLYEDPEIRLPGCPGLADKAWKQTLEQEGFTNIRFPAEKYHKMGQQIIAAQSSGEIGIQTDKISSDKIKLHSADKKIKEFISTGADIPYD